MVYGVIQNVKAALQQRKGWAGLFNHVYTNGDYPFKFGTLMGTDAGGNKYYENRIDYPFGQHRWVEPADIHNFDSTSIPPEWHGWMVSQNDTPPSHEAEYFDKAKTNILPLCHSDAPADHNVGHQEPVFHFHHLHNQTSVRSRGYGVGNPVVGLPPESVTNGAVTGYYKQPGSPYNEGHVKALQFIGDLDEGKSNVEKHRFYKSQKWADRLRTPEEKQAFANRNAKVQEEVLKQAVEETTKKAKRGGARGMGTMLAGE